MKTIEEFNPSAIARHSRHLCELARPHLGESGTFEVWSGKYGEVIVGDDGKHWIGDLCYMRQKFGWSHDDYMRAYGYATYPDEGWRDAPNLANNLQVHTFDGKHILVVNTGSDGNGPLGLGLDTAAVSFVSTERDRVEAAAEACRAFLRLKQTELQDSLKNAA